MRGHNFPCVSTFNVDKGSNEGGDEGSETLMRIGRRSEYEFVLGRRSHRVEQAALDPVQTDGKPAHEARTDRIKLESTCT